jgi:hypothetical protein
MPNHLFLSYDRSSTFNVLYGFRWIYNIFALSLRLPGKET